MKYLKSCLLLLITILLHNSINTFDLDLSLELSKATLNMEETRRSKQGFILDSCKLIS